jgi:drug/metabolite transporter (DMT)-like permease
LSDKPTLPYLWMLSGAVAFATMGTLAHALGPTCDWQIVALSRTALALVFSVTLTLLAGAQLVFFQPATLWMRSIAGSVSLVCTFYALPRLPVADVLTLTNVFPVWVALLSWPLLGEVPSKQSWIAIALGITGVVLVEQPYMSAEHSAAVLPAVSALVASFSTAIAMLGLHRLHAIDPRAVVAHFSGVALLVCLGSLFFIPNQAVASTHFTQASLPMLLGVGVSATAGQLFLTKAFAAGPPAKVSVVALAQVVFAVILDRMFWDHPFRPITLVGMVLVMAPTAWLMLSQEHELEADV